MYIQIMCLSFDRLKLYRHKSCAFHLTDIKLHRQTKSCAFHLTDIKLYRQTKSCAIHLTASNSTGTQIMKISNSLHSLNSLSLNNEPFNKIWKKIIVFTYLFTFIIICIQKRIGVLIGFLITFCMQKQEIFYHMSGS